VLLGDGRGGLSQARDFAVGTGPSGILTRDFNGDGQLDLAVSNTASDSVSILLGDGAGGFSSGGLTAAGPAPTAIAAGDFNRDKKPDLMIASSSGAFVRMLLGNGAGGFASPVSIPVAPGAVALLEGDLDGDLKDDVTVLYSTSVTTLLSDGGGGFQSTASPLNGPGCSSAAMVRSPVGNYILYRANGYFHAGNLFGAFDSGNYYGGSAVMPRADTVAVADFDGNGQPDLIGAGPQGVVVMMGGWAGNRAPAQSTLLTHTHASPDPPPMAVAGDLNGDGQMDVVTAHSYHVSVHLLDAGAVTSTVQYPTYFDTLSSVAVGDWNGDRKLDVAATCSGGLIVLLGDGTGRLQMASSRPILATGPYASQTGDFNRDGKLDLLLLDWNSSRILLSLGDGRGSFPMQNTVSLSGTSFLRSMAVGDYNGDSLLDVAASGLMASRLLLGDGAGGFAIPTPLTTDGVYSSMIAADFDGDHHLDLAGVSTPSGALSVLRNDGSAGFSLARIGSLAPGYLTTGDFDGDTRPDLAVGTASALSVLLSRTDGTFTAPANFALPVYLDCRIYRMSSRRET
jgi:hypothetical protein